MDSITVQIYKQQNFYHALEILMKSSTWLIASPKPVSVNISFCVWSHKLVPYAWCKCNVNVNATSHYEKWVGRLRVRLLIIIDALQERFFSFADKNPDHFSLENLSSAYRHSSLRNFSIVFAQISPLSFKLKVYSTQKPYRPYW